jgi:hypothetical protein
MEHETEMGKGAVLARPKTSVPKVWDDYYRNAEELAVLVEAEFNGHCQKLRDLKPHVEAVREAFKTLTGSKTIAGCRSFPEFCEKKLHRTKQAVYSMLGDYSKKPKNDGQSKGKKNMPERTATHHTLALADEDVECMRTGCNAAVRHFGAESRGDETEAEKAKQEFLAISKAESLKSTIFGDQPNYKMLLIDLLSEVEKVGEKLPVSLTRKCQGIRKRLGIDDASFGLEAQVRIQTNKGPEQMLVAQAG